MAISAKSRSGPPSITGTRSVDGSSRLVRPLSEAIAGLGKRVRRRDLIFFTSQLSLMLETGTALNTALRALREQTKSPYFKDVIHAMLRDVEEGRQLSDAMRRHPRIFDSILTSMIRAGETGGFLKDIIDRVIEMQEKRQALISQVRTALTYPIILCVVSVLVVIFVLVGILPKFMTFFEGKEHLLPITTRLMMLMSNSLRDYWWAHLSGFFLAIAGLRLFLQSDLGRAGLDLFCVKGPVVSRLFNKIYVCQMLRTLGHLMESKVPLLESLIVCRGTIKNRHFVRFIDRTARHVEQGGKLSQPFAREPFIMDTVKQMMVTAEESGKLPPVMLRLAEFYDTEAERELKAVSSIIEPLGLIVMGGVVGLIVASVILPMFRLAQAVS